LEPKHQKELLDLESQARAAESAYKENLQKANDPNFSKEEQAQFIVLANRSAQEAERIKQKIARNPLMEVSKYNYLDDLKKLANGNVPKPDKKPKSNIGNSNGYSINNNSNSNETNKDFFSKYHKEIILILISIGLATYIIYYQDE
jgi:DNA-directed RNA polymerase specialized sigma54-like protein